VSSNVVRPARCGQHQTQRRCTALPAVRRWEQQHRDERGQRCRTSSSHLRVAVWSKRRSLGADPLVSSRHGPSASNAVRHNSSLSSAQVWSWLNLHSPQSTLPLCRLTSPLRYSRLAVSMLPNPPLWIRMCPADAFAAQPQAAASSSHRRRRRLVAAQAASPTSY
jgi:hypothetical protein